MSALAASATGASASDLQLVERYPTTRDPVHLGTLFERYAHLALGVSLRYLRNREDAEDAVMEVYERVARALLVHEVSNFKSWLHSVVAKQCRMMLRRRRAHPRPWRPPRSCSTPSSPASPPLLGVVGKRESRKGAGRQHGTAEHQRGTKLG